MSETKKTTATTTSRTRTAITAGKPTTTPITNVSNILNEEAMASPTTLLSNDKKLLLKNQLHLNLNVTNTGNVENVESLDKRSRGNVRKLATVESVGVKAPTSEVVKFKDDVSYLETMTVTTVPQIHQKQQKSIIEATTTSILSSIAAAESSSLLNSSPSALAKFNRIIDSTMPATDCYQPKLEQTKQQKEEKIVLLQQQKTSIHDIVTRSDSEEHKKIDFTSKYDDDVGLDKEIDDGSVSRIVKENDVDDDDDDDDDEDEAEEEDDNQMKRNDVHYLLKQLNSFSDIEEIEIVDMKQTRQQQKLEQQSQQAVTVRALATTTPAIASATVITHSPTTTSLVIISPSSQSHKESRHVMRRFASLHQQRQLTEQNRYHQHQHYHQHRLQNDQLPHQQQQRYYALNASGGNLLELGDRIERLEGLDPATEQQYMLQQFDDYLFESCHYLETNYFAATYRTAMIESSSHEFRPSTTTTTGTRSSPTAASSSPHSYEIHEVELPSVICRAPPPPPSPTRRFNTQARLTSSGVQTELTASSLSSTTTTTSHAHAAAQSMAKSISSGSSGTSACSYASSTEERRRMPFFKCCYAPIGRWREKRSAAATTTATTAATSAGKTTGASVSGNISQRTRSGSGNGHLNLETTAGTSRGGSERQLQRQEQQKKHPHARKSGSAV